MAIREVAGKFFTPEEEELILDASRGNSEIKFGTPVYNKLYKYFTEITHEMPYGVAKARSGDPENWINARLLRMTRFLLREMLSTQETANTGHDKPVVDTFRSVAPKKMGDYTLGIMWDELTPAVMARIVRDCLVLSRVCRINRVNMHVASPHDNLDKYLKFFEVNRTASLEAASYWRVYCVKSVPEIPEHAANSEVIWVDKGVADGQTLSYDPEFPHKVWYPVYRIPETMPLNRTPPSDKADPFTQVEPW